MQDKISLAGDLGGGKSTVGRLLRDRLGMEPYSTGDICRRLAAERGMDVIQMNRYMETHPEFDREIDAGLEALSDDPRPLLIDSRMAWHFVRGTFRVYLSTEIEVSAARIMQDTSRTTEHFSSLEEAMAKVRERRDSEKKRYQAFYGVNNKDLHNYDLIVDTTYATPQEVADCICAALPQWQADRAAYRACYLSPLRLYYHETLPDDRVLALSERLAAGETLPPVDVYYDGERFLVKGEATLALGYALAGGTFVPCRLVKEEETGDFVRMGDSL